MEVRREKHFALSTTGRTALARSLRAIRAMSRGLGSQPELQ